MILKQKSVFREILKTFSGDKQKITQAHHLSEITLAKTVESTKELTAKENFWKNQNSNQNFLENYPKTENHCPPHEQKNSCFHEVGNYSKLFFSRFLVLFFI